MTDNLAPWTMATYAAQYEKSVADPTGFWGEVATANTTWTKPWQEVVVGAGAQAQWFPGGELNITYDCLDRHLIAGRGERVAYYWTNENKEQRTITYQALAAQVNRAANALRSLGVQKGDRVALYMPHTPEQIIAMLACARIGAIHTVVFAGFSSAALRVRLEDTQAKVLITASWTQRRGKHIPLLETARRAAADLPFIQHTIVWQRDQDMPLHSTEKDWDNLLATASPECGPVPMASQDPLFILYTSGTTGKPKGIVHAVGGYHVYSHFTTQTVFGWQDSDVLWCTADPGWITGHSYVVYGPLSVGATSLIMEGAPDWPQPDLWWSLIDHYQVSILYTAPTVIRLFMKYGEAYLQEHDLSSLRLLGSVGEPLNPEAGKWFSTYAGHDRCPLVDTWWQTETGGHLLVTLPGLPTKSGKAGLPFFGIVPMVVDDKGQPVAVGQSGQLRIQQSWPGALTTCWHNHERFTNMWDSTGYITGDTAVVDANGYWQILGRSDDVMNIAGHRLGSAEVENALITHPAVAEAAAVGIPDALTGEALVVFVCLRAGQEPDPTLATALQHHVATTIAKFARPAQVTFVEQLPKTRSGKIMRRLLRAQLLGETTGDTSTLAD